MAYEEWALVAVTAALVYATWILARATKTLSRLEKLKEDRYTLERKIALAENFVNRAKTEDIALAFTKREWAGPTARN